MSDLTPDDLARLRREAESASLHHYPLFSPETVLRLLDLAERTLRAEAEVERLRAVLAEAVKLLWSVGPGGGDEAAVAKGIVAFLARHHKG